MEAVRIISSSKRKTSPDVRTRIWALSDLEEMTRMPSVYNPQLPGDTETFSFGIGNNHHWPHLLEFAKNNDCNAMNETDWSELTNRVAAMPGQCLLGQGQLTNRVAAMPGQCVLGQGQLTDHVAAMLGQCVLRRDNVVR